MFCHVPFFLNRSRSDRIRLNNWLHRNVVAVEVAVTKNDNNCHKDNGNEGDSTNDWREEGVRRREGESRERGGEEKRMRTDECDGPAGQAVALVQTVIGRALSS